MLGVRCSFARLMVEERGSDSCWPGINTAVAGERADPMIELASVPRWPGPLSISTVGIGAWAPCICTFVLAVLLTGLTVKIANKRGWVAFPRPDRWNSRVV